VQPLRNDCVWTTGHVFRTGTDTRPLVDWGGRPGTRCGSRGTEHQQPGRQQSGGSIAAVTASTRPFRDIRFRELVAPKRSVAHAPGPSKVAPQQRAHTGKRHSGRLRRGARLETVRAQHFGSLACKPLAGSPSGRRTGPLFTTSVRSRPGTLPELGRRAQDHRHPGATGDREDPHAPGIAGAGTAARACQALQAA